MIKRCDDNGRLTFERSEVKKLLRAMGYTTTKRRIQNKIFKREMSRAVEKLVKELKK